MSWTPWQFYELLKSSEFEGIGEIDMSCGLKQQALPKLTLAVGKVVYEPGAVTVTLDTPSEAVAVAAVVLPLLEKTTLGTAVYPVPGAETATLTTVHVDTDAVAPLPAPPLKLTVGKVV